MLARFPCSVIEKYPQSVLQWFAVSVESRRVSQTTIHRKEQHATRIQRRIQLERCINDFLIRINAWAQHDWVERRARRPASSRAHAVCIRQKSPVSCSPDSSLSRVSAISYWLLDQSRLQKLRSSIWMFSKRCKSAKTFT